MFKGCGALVSVRIPSTVNSIPFGAFDGASSLARVNNIGHITSIGSYAFRGTSLSEIVMPDAVRSIEPYVFASIQGLNRIDLNNVTSIGANAFRDSKLDSLKTKNVAMINENAFFGTTIQSLSFDNTRNKPVVAANSFTNAVIDSLYIGCNFASSSTPFAGLTRLKKLEIGGNKMVVLDGEFKNCTGLEQLVTNYTVSTIGAEAFSGCENMVDVTLGDNITSIKHHAFYNSGIRVLTYPRYLTEITEYSFANCKNLQVAIIAPTVRKIEAYAGSGIRTASVPSTIESIPEHLFYNCNDLEDLTLSEGNKFINMYAFENTGIQSMIIPRSVTNIANGAFNGCAALKVLRFNDGSTNLSLGVNSTGKGLFADCKITDLYIGRILKYDATSGSGYSPFYGIRTLENATVGDIPNEVYRYQFYKCSGLKHVTVGDGVTHIGEYAFSGCAALDEFTLGANITELGPDAFSDCQAMTKMTAYPIMPPHCGSQALDDINKWDCTLYVPRQSKSRYSAAEQWQDFFNTEEFDAGLSVSFIEINGSASTLNVGQRMQLTATVYPQQVANTPLQWTSSNEQVATVDATGLITAISVGKARITALATDGSGVSATYDISVINPDAPQPYIFSIDRVGIGDDYITYIPVNLRNENPVNSFQCDIILPPGLTIAKDEYGDYDFELSDRSDTTHDIVSSDIDGKIRIVSYSSKNRSYSGNNGTLFYIPVVVDEMVEDGTELTLAINNASVMVGDNEMPVPDFTTVLIVRPEYEFTPGDVNGDGRFTIADVTLTVEYVLGKDPAKGIREAADVNGDGKISIADITSVVNLVLTNGK